MRTKEKAISISTIVIASIIGWLFYQSHIAPNLPPERCVYCNDRIFEKRDWQQWESWYCDYDWTKLSAESGKVFGCEWSRERLMWIKSFAVHFKGKPWEEIEELLKGEPWDQMSEGF